MKPKTLLCRCKYPLTVGAVRCTNCAEQLCPLCAFKAQMRAGLCPPCAQEHEADLLDREWRDMEDAKYAMQPEPRSER